MRQHLQEGFAPFELGGCKTRDQFRLGMLDVVGRAAKAIRFKGKPRITMTLPVTVHRKPEHLQPVRPGGVKPAGTVFTVPDHKLVKVSHTTFPRLGAQGLGHCLVIRYATREITLDRFNRSLFTKRD